MADEYLKRITNGEDLSFDESRELMLGVGHGEYSQVQVASILTGLKVKGETVTEIAGCASAFRELALKVPHNVEGGIFDCCGTGGDGSGTFNISTAASIVTAAMGVATAKHGNRAVSSQCGSADVLEALGVRIDLNPENAAKCLHETDFCFLFAPNYHPAMKHVAPVRRELGIPTLFNLLGPLLNPAGCTHQIIGTPNAREAEIIAQTAHRIGLDNVTTMHNDLGVDEMIYETNCYLHRATDNGLDTRTLLVQDGDGARIEDLVGGDASTNAAIIRAIFGGEKSYRTSTVVLNAAVGLIVAGRFDSLDEAKTACAGAVYSGKVKAKLRNIAEVTEELSDA
jgi:anthranilate phosphoribosyltransferase